MKTNPIFQVLVVSNATLKAAAAAIDSLATGQLGVFNADTNLTFTNMAAIPDRFYFAVGALDADGNQDVKKSAGESIRKHLVNIITSKKYVAPSVQTTDIDLTGYAPEAETEYVVRMEFMSGATLQRDGFTKPVKSFTLSTGVTAPTLADFIDAFVEEINKDPEGVVVASNVTDTSLLLTFTSEAKVNALAGINPNYTYLRQFSVTTSLKEGFEGAGAVITVTEPVYEQGSGYDLQREEYVAAGWTGNPGLYRDSELNGIFQSAGFAPLAVAGTNYWVMRWNYELPSNSGGFLSYENQVETVIAIPDTAPNQGLINALYVMADTYMAAQAQTSGLLENYTA